MDHFASIECSTPREVWGSYAWNVTQDIDLGVRLARAGFRVASLRSTTVEESPANLAGWLRQRRRWMKGWMQTLVTHTRQPGRFLRELGPRHGIASWCMIVSGVAGPLLGPVFGSCVIIDAIFGDLLAPKTLADWATSALWIFIGSAGAISAAWPAYEGIKRRGLMRLAPLLPALVLYYCLQTIAAWAALFEFFRDPYVWAKTEHGLAKTSRRRLQVGEPV